MKEAVNHPQHYNSLPARCDKCGDFIECIEVVRHMGFNTGNAIKYIWRSDYKENTIEDLKKAIWYLEDEIKQREKNEELFNKTEGYYPSENDEIKKIKDRGLMPFSRKDD